MVIVKIDKFKPSSKVLITCLKSNVFSSFLLNIIQPKHELKVTQRHSTEAPGLDLTKGQGDHQTQ